MAKFKAHRTEKPAHRTNFIVHVPPETHHVINRAAADAGLTKTELVRQMVLHCLDDMGYKP